MTVNSDFIKSALHIYLLSSLLTIKNAKKNKSKA